MTDTEWLSEDEREIARLAESDFRSIMTNDLFKGSSILLLSHLAAERQKVAELVEALREIRSVARGDQEGFADETDALAWIDRYSQNVLAKNGGKP